jgi:DNA-binding Lrp family transcriptional regulator
MIEFVNRSPRDVAGDLASIPELISVNVTSGQFSVVARLMAADRKELARIVGQAIASTAGVRRVSCEWVAEHAGGMRPAGSPAPVRRSRAGRR